MHRSPSTCPTRSALGNGALVVLTDRPLITVSSADLVAGLDGRGDAEFSTAGVDHVRVPVVDGNQQQYATISPTPGPPPS